MKKILSLFAAIFMAASMWGATQSFTITFKDSGAASDASTKRTALADIVASGSSYVTVNGTPANVYNAREGYGLKFGSSSATGSLTLNLVESCTPDSIVFTVANYSSSEGSIKLQGGSAIDITNATSRTIVKKKVVYDGATTVSSISMATTSKRAYFIDVTVYYDDAAGSLTTPSWSANPESIVVNKAAQASTTITTNYDGALTVDTEDHNIATASYNSTTKTITVTGVAGGTTNVTVTGSATATYYAISKKIAVTVNVPEGVSNKTVDLTDQFTNTFFGVATVQSNEDDIEKTSSIVYMHILKNNGNAPRYDANYVRHYNKNTFVVEVPTGWNLTSVTFVEPATEKAWAGTFTASTGFYDNATKKWIAESATNTVTFTNDNTKRIGGIIVKAYNANYVAEVTISDAQYATYYNADHAFTMPAGLEGIVVYEVNGSSLNLQTGYDADDVVPAGEPLILHGDAGSYILYAGATTDPTMKSADMNLLSGTSTAEETTTGGDKYYRLSVHEGVVGFYYGAANGAAFKPGANKAYLAISNTSAPAHFTFTDEVTAVENVEATETVKFMENGQLFIKKNGVIYNAMGQVVK